MMMEFLLNLGLNLDGHLRTHPSLPKKKKKAAIITVRSLFQHRVAQKMSGVIQTIDVSESVGVVGIVLGVWIIISL